MPSMDLSLQESLLSALFILLGSLAFNISALISGYNVYKEMAGLQSIALSLGAGILVFFLSPVGFIIAFASPVVPIICNYIFDFGVLIPFLFASLGLGLIFGCLVTLEARENFLLWFRDHSGIRFWINSYSIIWDFFFRRVRRGGEITVKTKGGETLDCRLEYYSMRKVPREIAIKSCRDDEGHMLIKGSEIESVKIPRHSFRKHYGLITPIGQAFYFGLVCFGLLLLSFNANQTEMYIISDKGENLTEAYNSYLSENETVTHISISGLDLMAASNINLTADISHSVNKTETYMDWDSRNLFNFYKYIRNCFLFFSIIVFFSSMYLAYRDYSSWEAYKNIGSDCMFMFVLSSVISCYSFYLFFLSRFLFLFSSIIFGFLSIIFGFLSIYLLKRIKKYAKIVLDIEDNILNKFVVAMVGYESFNRVLSIFFLNLCRNFPHDHRSHLENVRDEVYNKLPDEDLEVAEKLLFEIDNLKNNYKILRNEDF